MLIMISRLCLVRSKSILVILNSDFDQIVLRKTVIVLYSPSFTSRYKVFITYSYSLPYHLFHIRKQILIGSPKNPGIGLELHASGLYASDTNE